MTHEDTTTLDPWTLESLAKARDAFGDELPDTYVTLVCLSGSYLADALCALDSGYLDASQEHQRIAAALAEGADALLTLNMGQRIAAAVLASDNEPKD